MPCTHTIVKYDTTYKYIGEANWLETTEHYGYICNGVTYSTGTHIKCPDLGVDYSNGQTSGTASHQVTQSVLSCGKTTSTIENYSINCGKTTSTVTGYQLSCGKTTSTIIGYSLNCGKTTSTIDSYQLNCGKTDTTIESYQLSCRKTEDTYYDETGIAISNCNNIIVSIQPLLPKQENKKERLNFSLIARYLDGHTAVIEPTSTNYNYEKEYKNEPVKLDYMGIITKAGNRGTLSTSVTITTK